MDLSDPKALLFSLMWRGIKAAVPHIPSDLIPDPPKGRLFLVGAGKASQKMAESFLQQYKGNVEGLIIIPDDQDITLTGVKVFQASHPVPDERGLRATQNILNLLEKAGPDDKVVALVSGGGSALLCAPKNGINFNQKQKFTKKLLYSGLTIKEINKRRIQMSSVKGGGLLRAASPAPVTSFVVSDVPGDDLSLVASGPTIRSPEDLQDVHMLASGATMLGAVERLAKEAGLDTINLGDAVEGEAGDVAAHHAAMAGEAKTLGRPTLILSGGETTVSIGDAIAGKGGRNTEYALALAVCLDGLSGVYALAVDSDGKDGNAGAAGAFMSSETLANMKKAGVDAGKALSCHDSASAFVAVDGLISTGSTGTNVNDLRMILVLP